MASRRTSTRNLPRKKYTVDAFEGVEELRSSRVSDDEQGDDIPEATPKDADEDDEFNTETESPSPGEDQVSDEEQDDIAGDAGEDANDFASDAGEVDLDEGISIVDEDAPDAIEDQDPTTSRRARQPKLNADGQVLYTRGADEGTVSRHSGVWRTQNYYGPAKEDRESINRACRRWSRDTALPTRQPRHENLGGFEYPVSYETALKNAHINWRWYTSNGGKEVFGQRQALREITADEARPFRCVDGTGNRSLLMGPIKDQKLAHLTPGESMPLAEPFEADGIAQSRGHKPGFLLNLGARVQALDWVPNRRDVTQYLAVSTIVEREEAQPRLDRQRAPGFAPGLPHQSGIQIWRFAATPENYVDRHSVPQLAMMLCTAVGDVKALKWCPVPSEMPVKLGLLACVNADGAVRVLDIDTPQLGSETHYRAVEKFAFASKPPDTICTCLTWLSSTRIAAGCANGFIAVWDLSQCVKSQAERPRPVIYASISVTYILGISSCWPSYPHLLAATSMAGRLTLTDITKPRPASPENTVASIRTRIAQQALRWNDHTQSVFSVDDSYVVRSYLFRRFFTTLGVARFHAITLCMATSPCHPFVLAGTANGEVLSCNPIIRIANGSKAPLWQQTWFRHEWRRPAVTDQTLAEEHGQDQARVTIARDGLTRFLEGFKVENINLNFDGKTGSNIKDGTPYTTIYEEGTAITALAWNPNIRVGGWAAAGMGDGLLRVEDLAS